MSMGNNRLAMKSQAAYDNLEVQALVREVFCAEVRQSEALLGVEGLHVHSDGCLYGEATNGIQLSKRTTNEKARALCHVTQAR